MMPDEMPQAFKDASAEFIAIIEPVLRKKGHGSPLLHVLEGLAELRSLRMMPQWWHQVSSDARVASLLGIQLSGKDGWDRVESLRAYLDELTGQVANRRSPLDWSMILRMFGHEFYKAIPIASRILGAAITYTSDSPLPDRYLRYKTQRWLSGPAVLNDLDDLLSLVILCCNLDAVQRRIGKGQVLVLGPQFLPVQVGGDPEVDMSIQLYDGRRHISIGERAGAESGSAGMSYTSRDAQDIVMTWVDIRNHKLLSRRDETRLLEKHDPIVPFAASVRSLAPVHIFSESMTRETCAVVSILDAAWRWLVLRGANFARKRGTWTQYGYIECSHHWLVRDLTVNNRPIAESHIELTAEEVLRILSPESLSVAYPLGRRVIIDLLSASRVLEGTVFRAEEGANANEWGSAFEAAVQGVVDTSPWRPPDWLRPLIGACHSAERSGGDGHRCYCADIRNVVADRR
jgi:hypothetical protein